MSLFHRAGEDRVETATMAVLARCDLSVVRDLFADAGGLGDDLPGPAIAPATMRTAARITARVDWSFEIVTVRGAFDSEGPERDRVRRLAAGLEDDDWLFVLTPDPPAPEWLAAPDGLGDEVRGHIVWVSYLWLATAVRDLLSDPTRLVDARSHVLLAELIELYDAEGLLEHEDDEGELEVPAHREGQDPTWSLASRAPGAAVEDTLVVAGREAWRDFLDHAAYVLPAGRTMSPAVVHVGYSQGGRIMAVLPRVVDHVQDVELSTRGVADLRRQGRWAAADVVASLARDERHAGHVRTVLLLTPAGDPACVRLDRPLEDPGTTSPRLTRLELLTASADA